MSSNVVALSECVKLGGHNEQYVSYPTTYRHRCAKVLAAMVAARNLSTKIRLWKAKMLKCEAISNDFSTGPNCSNGIIVYYSTYYSLFTTPRSTYLPPFHGAGLRRCYAHSGL
ncbi:hypothetical protein TNCV_2921211 [Trichonephila clavipes]|nr:hypothetical protein TNCV_2921211 [Trichonephila clavipes]